MWEDEHAHAAIASSHVRESSGRDFTAFPDPVLRSQAGATDAGFILTCDQISNARENKTNGEDSGASDFYPNQ